MTHTYIHIVINKRRIKQDIYSHEWSSVYIIIQIYKLKKRGKYLIRKGNLSTSCVACYRK